MNIGRRQTVEHSYASNFYSVNRQHKRHYIDKVPTITVTGMKWWESVRYTPWKYFSSFFRLHLSVFHSIFVLANFFFTSNVTRAFLLKKQKKTTERERETVHKSNNAK